MKSKLSKAARAWNTVDEAIRQGFAPLRPLGTLSDLERKMLAWAQVPFEYADKRMGIEMGVPETTVKWFWKVIRLKLGATTRAGAVGLYRATLERERDRPRSQT